ncbi:MAG: class IV adenylate cyclase [Methanomassiliicoccales archaeon]|nr:MAG: class IV adenylate cyclase [Methanomassiliicoccales archaeon]
MPIEVEVKAYAVNLKEIEEKILSMGVRQAWQGEQVDTYFNHPARDFKTTDEALRVREVEGKTVLTYKGPKIDTLSKTREEINVQVEDALSTQRLLKKLGFEEVGVVRKLRKKYFLGEFKVCLDEVDNLGEFVERELSVATKDSDAQVKKLRDSIIRTLDSFGLKRRERRSYLELLLENPK